MKTKGTTNGYENLRELLVKYKIDGYIVPSTDEFNNEYVPNHLKRLEYVTGFTGSNGLGLILKDMLIFFTDGRYLLQASLELDKEFKIFDYASKDYEKVFSKLNGCIIGFDPNLFTKATHSCYERMAVKYGIVLKAIDENLVDEIWLSKPKTKKSEIIELGQEFTGKASLDKIKELLTVFPQDADYLFLSSPDSICWLLNLRASDIEYTPFLLSYALIDKSGKVELFLDKQNMTFKLLRTKINNFENLKSRYRELIQTGNKIALDAKRTSYWFFMNTPQKQLVNIDDPCQVFKSCKNQLEVKGFRDCHVEDGVALCKFLYWLENNIHQKFNEIQASEKLLEFRKSRKYFQYPSFGSISAFGANAAIIHYQPKLATNKVLTNEGLYLIDSGGQYLNGTTDVTRVTCFGKPSQEQVKNFTLVLQGHIQIAKSIFPEGTTGLQLDVLARFALWQNGKDYEHGTGHGVGHFLAVHEGPQRIGKASACYVPLKLGMIISNEPGFYKKEEYGMRIESLVLVKEAKYPGFLEFETLTLVPIERKLIDKQLLSQDERAWINKYHKQVYDKIGKHLDAAESKWLSEKTKPL